MSQILSGLILTELQKIDSEPALAKGQKDLADALATAMSTYLRSVVVNPVVTTPAPGPGPHIHTTLPSTLQVP